MKTKKVTFSQAASADELIAAYKAAINDIEESVIDMVGLESKK